MRRWILFWVVIALAVAFAAPAGAVYVEEKPDFWGAFCTGPVWFDHFGWGVYVQGGYYFTRWLGAGLGIDWSMDARPNEVEHTQEFDSQHGWTTETWINERRRAFFPGADVRLRWPILDNFQIAFDFGLGVGIDNTWRERKVHVFRNNRTTETIEDISPKDAETAFMLRPSLVFKIYNVGVGYRLLWLANGDAPGHMGFVGIDWDI